MSGYILPVFYRAFQAAEDGKAKAGFLGLVSTKLVCALPGRGLSSHLVQGFSQPASERDLVLELASSHYPASNHRVGFLACPPS